MALQLARQVGDLALARLPRVLRQTDANTPAITGCRVADHALDAVRTGLLPAHVEDVDHAIRGHAELHAGRVIRVGAADLLGCGQIPAAHAFEPDRGRLDGQHALGPEQRALARVRALLVQGFPVARPLRYALLRQRFGGLPLRPDRCPARAAERIIVPVSDRLQREHGPVLAVTRPDHAGFPVVFLRQDAAGQIVFVPARHDQHDSRAGFQARAQVGEIPVVDARAHDLAVSLLARFDRIVDHGHVGAPAGDRAADAGSEILGPGARIPSPGSARLAGQAGGLAEHAGAASAAAVSLVRDDAAHAPAEALGQLGRV